MLSNGYRSIPEIHYAIYIIWCLLGYICSCFLHTLDRLVRGYKLFCTLPRKSRRFIAREQKLVYSSKYDRKIGKFQNGNILLFIYDWSIEKFRKGSILLFICDRKITAVYYYSYEKTQPWLDPSVGVR